MSTRDARHSRARPFVIHFSSQAPYNNNQTRRALHIATTGCTSMSDHDDPRPLHHFDDSATGEHPVLTPSVPDESPTGEIAFLPAAAGLEAPVVAGLEHLESEIARLHERWREVEQHFNRKDAAVAKLKSEIDVRAANAADLESQLAGAARQLASVEDALAAKHGEAAQLQAQVAAHEAALAENEAKLRAAVAQHDTARSELDAARVEIARLEAELRREQAAAGAAATRNEELGAAHAALKQRIQELEDYIDGRASSWTSLQTEIAGHRGTIARLEKTLKAQERAVEDAERRRHALEAELTELTGRNEALRGERKEREAAYLNLERRLEDIRAAHSWLQNDLARYRAEQQRLIAKASDDRALIGSLEAELGQRTEALESHERELVAARELVDELRAAKTSLAELLEQQQGVTARLTQELADRQADLDILSRSVRRISDLGASVAALERRFEKGSPVADRESPAEPRHGADDVEELLPAATFLTSEAEDAATPSPARRSNGGARKLVGIVGGEAVDYALGKSEVTIGRGKTSDIRIQSHYISRHHARICTRGIATTIEDVGSKNGILVNRERVTRAVLRDGDVVTLASELELQFVDARH